MRRHAAWGLLLLAACSDASLDVKNGSTRPCRDAVSVSATVAPVVLVRGSAVPVEVRWELDRAASGPVLATLTNGVADNIEVELPLKDVESPAANVYSGTLMNPYGLGAPVGEVAVILTTRPTGCDTGLSAATSFTLE